MNSHNNNFGYTDEEDEIDLKDLLFILLNNIPIIIITSILFLAIGMAVAVTRPKVYEANVVLMVNDNDYMFRKIDKAELSLNQNLVSTYTEIAKNKEISSQIIEKYDIPLTAEQMRKKIKVTPVGETEFINISYKDRNPRMTAMITNEIATEFMIKVEDIMGIQNLKIIEKAFTPKDPVDGKKKLIVAVSFVLGGFLGIFIIFVKEFFCGNIKKTEDISKILNTKIVAYIPDYQTLKKGKNNFLNFNIGKKEKIKEDDNEYLFFGENMDTPVTDTFRKLKNNLKFDVKGDNKILAFTSSISGEGKTTVSINYALSQSLSGKKVLLIDCDMRKSKIETAFGLDSNKKGLYSYINGDLPLEKIIIKNFRENLDIIIAEKNKNYSPEMLHKKELHKLFVDLKKDYDLIILDTSPIGVTSDLGSISEYLDSLVIVCGYNMITKKQLIFENETLKNLDINVIGIVINKIERSAYSSLGTYVDYYSPYYDYLYE
jgi:capsular exopolysaccharide synthesis family protein